MVKYAAYTLQQYISKNAFGASARVGALYFFADNWFFDLFVDYYYQTFRFKNSPNDEPYVERYHLNMSAVKVGGGIGLAF